MRGGGRHGDVTLVVVAVVVVGVQRRKNNCWIKNALATERTLSGWMSNLEINDGCLLY